MKQKNKRRRQIMKVKYRKRSAVQIDHTNTTFPFIALQLQPTIEEIKRTGQ